MERKIRIGINGFGRIGRAVFRINKLKDLFEVVVINDINDNVENLCYLMKYDSIHGILDDEIKAIKNEIIFNGSKIKVFFESKVENVPWNDLGVDIVVESTGNLVNVANARRCLGSSVKKVVFSDSPAEHIDFTFVFGVNEDEYNPKKHNIIACSICDVVGLAPALKKLDEEYGIESGYVLTLHPWLSYQNIMDGRPKSMAFRDKSWTHYAIGRGSIGALIPKDTSLVVSLERVMPFLKGRLKGMSFRVPTEIVASAYASLLLKKETQVHEVKNFLRSCSNEPIMGYTEEPMISVDYKHHSCSCIVDGKWIEVLNNRLLRMSTWYDNEWGYSSRIVDLIEYIASKGL